MNLSAFSKILKKYEKVTSKRIAMNMVDGAYLGSSEEVIGLLNRVEVIFVKHFSNSNRREGMKLLRPKRKREQHRITFFSGFFSGCSIVLLIAVILIIQEKKIIDSKKTDLHVDTIFPLYSFYAYIVLYMLLYAAYIFFWRRYRINYIFILGFKQGTELGYRSGSFSPQQWSGNDSSCEVPSSPLIRCSKMSLGTMVVYGSLNFHK